jgi:hypothetical protein
MLLHIDSSVSRALTSNDSTTFLELVALAHREGKHLVTGASDTLRTLASSSQVAASTRGALLAMASKAVQWNALRQLLPFYIEVGSGAQFLNVTSGSQVQSILRVEIDWLTDSELLQRPVILTENGTDAETYIQLAQAFVRSKGWNIKLELDPQGAGGSTTARELTKVMGRKRACLCVVDSDRSCPQCGLGSTASAVQSVGAGSGIHQSRIIGAREIENLLPVKLLEMALPDSYSRQLAQYMELQSLSAEAVTYLDMKKGLSAGRILRMPISSHERNFWVAIDEQAQIALARYAHCTSPVSCVDSSCVCVLCKPFGDSVLEKALVALKKCSPRTLSQLGIGDTSVLGKLCLDLVAFGCSAGPSRT